ncbi:MAG: hypothetical protein JHC84_18720 [Solirubrobacteraceae bacterium]|nr:hypothetical protein [Solirubrobacteraceae bacterium]
MIVAQTYWIGLVPALAGLMLLVGIRPITRALTQIEREEMVQGADPSQGPRVRRAAEEVDPDDWPFGWYRHTMVAIVGIGLLGGGVAALLGAWNPYA